MLPVVEHVVVRIAAVDLLALRALVMVGVDGLQGDLASVTLVPLVVLAALGWEHQARFHGGVGPGESSGQVVVFRPRRLPGGAQPG